MSRWNPQPADSIFHFHHLKPVSASCQGKRRKRKAYSAKVLRRKMCEMESIWKDAPIMHSGIRHSAKRRLCGLSVQRGLENNLCSLQAFPNRVLMQLEDTLFWKRCSSLCAEWTSYHQHLLDTAVGIAGVNSLLHCPVPVSLFGVVGYLYNLKNGCLCHEKLEMITCAQVLFRPEVEGFESDYVRWHLRKQICTLKEHTFS